MYRQKYFKLTSEVRNKYNLAKYDFILIRNSVFDQSLDKPQSLESFRYNNFNICFDQVKSLDTITLRSFICGRHSS